jgi:hypothetical protein
MDNGAQTHKFCYTSQQGYCSLQKLITHFKTTQEFEGEMIMAEEMGLSSPTECYRCRVTTLHPQRKHE